MDKTLTSSRHRALVGLLVAARQRSGMTQTELAKHLNEYQSFVARLESGQRRVDVVELIRLSEVLGFAPDDMVRAVAAVQDS